MRWIVYTVLAAVLVAATATAPASADVEQIPVSGFMYPTGVVYDWGETWQSGNVEHTRGVVFQYRMVGTGAEGVSRGVEVHPTTRLTISRETISVIHNRDLFRTIVP